MITFMINSLTHRGNNHGSVDNDPEDDHEDRDDHDYGHDDHANQQ